MSELKKVLLSVVAFIALTNVGKILDNGEPVDTALASSTGSSGVLDGTSKNIALSESYQVVDSFSIGKNERASVWLEQDAVVMLEGTVIYVASSPRTISFTEAGNYLILDRK